MSSHKILAPSVLLICLAILLVNTVSATTPSLPVFPLGEEMRDLPIKVYWKDGPCAPTQREVIKNGVNIALGVLAGGANVLTREYSEGFAGFDSLRFVLVSTAESAQIIVTDANIGKSGRTTLSSLRGRIIPPARIELGCDLASMGIDAVVTVALHEFGHALGLGHADFEEYNGVKELMYPMLRQFTYPSTLDFYAIYLLVIKGYSGSSVSLPGWLPYMQVSPQGLVYPEVERGGGEVSREEVTTLAELEKKINDLFNKVSSLENRVIGLEGDIQIIERKINELERRTNVLENATLELRRLMDETETALRMHFEYLNHLDNSISQLTDAMTSQSERFEKVIAELIINLEKLRSGLNDTYTRWSKNFSIVIERQDTLDERLKSQEERGQMLYVKSEQMRSEIELLKLRILALEESLKERDMQIMHIQNFNTILSMMLAAALTIAIVSLIQMLRIRKAVRSVIG